MRGGAATWYYARAQLSSGLSACKRSGRRRSSLQITASAGPGRNSPKPSLLPVFKPIINNYRSSREMQTVQNANAITTQDTTALAAGGCPPKRRTRSARPGPATPAAPTPASGSLRQRSRHRQRNAGQLRHRSELSGCPRRRRQVPGHNPAGSVGNQLRTQDNRRRQSMYQPRCENGAEGPHQNARATPGAGPRRRRPRCDPTVRHASPHGPARRTGNARLCCHARPGRYCAVQCSF